MKKYLILLFILITNVYLFSGEIHPTLEAKLGSLGGKDIIQVIIELNIQADLSLVKGNRGRVITLLKTIANSTQSRILNFLNTEKNKNTVTSLKSYHIFNGLFVECTKEIVLKLAGFSEVKIIYENETVSTAATGTPNNRISNANSLLNSSSDYWWNIEKIGAKKAREQLGVDGSGVIVGIIDEGFSGNHPDLFPRWKSQFGWRDFVNNQPNPYDSNNGHGTQVTGIIVAGNNSGDEIGVAPGAQFISAKAFHNHSGFAGDILDAMEWMLDPDDDGNPNTGSEHVPDVVNNSWGGSTYSTYFWNAVDSWIAAGIFPCFIAQNFGPNPSTVRMPGSYPQSFCVGAVDDNDAVQNFSGRGPVTWSGVTYFKPDVVAPSGPNIKFCIPTDQTWWQQNYPSGYLIGSGATSTAGPHVTGAVALIKSAYPNWDIDQIKLALESTATDLGTTGKDNDYGSGRIDVFRAITPPPAPQNLVITNAGSIGQNPNLTWGASVGANSYNIYRKVSFVSYWFLVGSTSGTSYTDVQVEILSQNDPDAEEFLYHVKAENHVGESGPSNEASVWGFGPYKESGDSLITVIKEMPDDYFLENNYPNPFNPTTEIKYGLPQNSHVIFNIYNVVGQKIRTLANEQKKAGYYNIFWDGKDDFGNEVASGIYIYRIYGRPNDINKKPFEAVKKMTLMR